MFFVIPHFLLPFKNLYSNIYLPSNFNSPGSNFQCIRYASSLLFYCNRQTVNQLAFQSRHFSASHTLPSISIPIGLSYTHTPASSIKQCTAIKSFEQLRVDCTTNTGIVLDSYLCHILTYIMYFRALKGNAIDTSSIFYGGNDHIVIKLSLANASVFIAELK